MQRAGMWGTPIGWLHAASAGGLHIFGPSRDAAVVVVVVGGKHCHPFPSPLPYPHLFTVGSAILFWLAKKRQWNVRQSLRRASRRFTGRSTTDVSTKRQNRRTGVRLNSPPPRGKPTPERDVEKALPDNSRKGKTTTTITSTFDVDTPTPKGWKASLLGGKK